MYLTSDWYYIYSSVTVYINNMVFMLLLFPVGGFYLKLESMILLVVLPKKKGSDIQFLDCVKLPVFQILDTVFSFFFFWQKSK